jgi:hypothetical protein
MRSQNSRQPAPPSPATHALRGGPLLARPRAPFLGRGAKPTSCQTLGQLLQSHSCLRGLCSHLKGSWPRVLVPDFPEREAQHRRVDRQEDSKHRL